MVLSGWKMYYWKNDQRRLGESIRSVEDYLLLDAALTLHQY